MEERLKCDIKHEMKDGKLYLTLENIAQIEEREDEEDFYFNKQKKIEENGSRWFNITSLETPNELYKRKAVNYKRLPVSDERFPLPLTVDKLIKSIRALPDNHIVIFNCQMGKGRTTTGMVISFLYKYIELEKCDHEEAEDYPVVFLLIDLLLKLLPNSEQSLKITNFAIDKFSHLENFRTVMESIEFDKPIVAVQFLERYFYLICFTEALIQNYTSFVCFLSDNPEISDLINNMDKLNLERIYK